MAEIKFGGMAYFTIMVVSFLVLGMTIAYAIKLSEHANFELSNRINIADYSTQLMLKLTAHPNLNKFRPAKEGDNLLFGLSKISLNSNYFECLQLNQKSVGKYLIILGNTYIIYDFDREKIINIINMPVCDKLFKVKSVLEIGP